MPREIRKKIVLFDAMIFLLALCVLLLDRITKLAATRTIPLNQSVPVIENVFHLTLVHNKGAAFGIFKNQTVILIAVSLITIAAIYNKLRTRKGLKSDVMSVSLALLLGGALGNVIDRIFLGYVIDFLDFRIWPIFNIADSAITVAAVLLGYSLLKSRKINTEDNR